MRRASAVSVTWKRSSPKREASSAQRSGALDDVLLRGLRLDLYRRAGPGCRPGRDHEIASLHVDLTPHHLTDRPQRIDDRRPRRIRRERRQRLERTMTVRRTRQREHVRLFRLESGDGSLEHLEKALVE